MSGEPINKLKNIIATKRSVNYYSRDFILENPEEIETFLQNLKEEYKNLFVSIDIKEFKNCKTEEDEAIVLVDLINRELTAKDFAPFDQPTISISSALLKWGNTLQKRALLVFHCFHDIYSEQEKRILRSLRKAFRNQEEMNSYLGILIVSNRKVVNWELMPESNLDDRHVTFFEI